VRTLHVNEDTYAGHKDNIILVLLKQLQAASVEDKDIVIEPECAMDIALPDLEKLVQDKLGRDANKSIQATRPIVLYDLETTGVDPETDRVTQIAAYKIWPGESIDEAIVTLKGYIDQGVDVQIQDRIICYTINPERIVSDFILELTHLTQDRLNASCTFGQWAGWLQHFFDNAVSPEGVDHGIVDWAGFNITKFDTTMLEAEFRRTPFELKAEGRHMLDSFQVFVKKEPRNLAAATQFYCGEDIEGAHNALVDIQATLKVMQAQTRQYADMPEDNEGIAAYGKHDDWIDSTGKFRKEGFKVVIAIGKHAGTELSVLAQTQGGYLRWMLDKDFPADAKKIARDALNGVYIEI
jgi:DNA polymerase-3 subunit epsilon